jgi:hypothetical protein
MTVTPTRPAESEPPAESGPAADIHPDVMNGGDRMLAGALSITAPTSRLNVGRLTGSLRTAALGIGRKLQVIGR